MSKKTSKASANKPNNRGADLASTSRQRFKEEILTKEHLSRIKLYTKMQEANKNGQEAGMMSKQCEVFKERIEKSLPKPPESLIELAENKPVSVHQYKIKKIDPERLALERIQQMKPTIIDKTSPFYTSSNSEYGWWQKGKGKELVRNSDKGRKNIIKETFYRRNGVGECMAV